MNDNGVRETKIEADFEVIRVQTMRDNAIRITLEMPEYMIPQMGMFAECQRSGIYLHGDFSAAEQEVMKKDNIDNEMQTTFIYGLKDPRDGLIHYIGKSNTPKLRIEDHLADKESNEIKVQWIETLLSDDLLPELVILEEVDRKGWSENERQWIAKGNLEGWPLTNNKLEDELGFDALVSEFDEVPEID